jgi:SH3-like domain-containing protein
LLGEQLKIIDKDESWLKVSQWDGYKGWINSSAVTEKQAPEGESCFVADLLTEFMQKGTFFPDSA